MRCFVIFVTAVCLSVWIHKNDAIELSLCRTLSERFLLSRNSKGDDIKMKRKVSPFFPSFRHLSSFHCRPFSIFCPFTWLGGSSNVLRNHREIRVIGVHFYKSRQIYVWIYENEAKGLVAHTKGELFSSPERTICWNVA